MKSALINSKFFKPAAVLFFILFSNCASMAVYDSIYPDNISSPFNPSDIEKVSMLVKDIVKIHWRSFLFQKNRCFKYNDYELIYEVNSYSVHNCENSKDSEINMKPDEDFPLYWLPVLNTEGDILDLKNMDKYSYYHYTESVKNLKDLKLRRAEFNKKENAVILSGTDGSCHILQRSEYGTGTAAYSIKDLYLQAPDECRKLSSPKNENIPFQKNKGNTVLLEFKDRSRTAYTAPEGSGRTVKYLRIYSLDSTPNYLYAVLYPPALVFDIVTFPFQFIYLYALGSSLPPR